MTDPVIRRVTYRVIRGENMAEVRWLVILSDGRAINVTAPFNQAMTGRQAVAGSRRLAEEKVFTMLRQEHETGLFHCCHGVMPKHDELCQAML